MYNILLYSLQLNFYHFKAQKIRSELRSELREMDLNQRPSGYEPDELPDCSIPR